MPDESMAVIAIEPPTCGCCAPWIWLMRLTTALASVSKPELLIALAEIWLVCGTPTGAWPTVPSTRYSPLAIW